jgi:RNA polymerase sigma-70 factor (ECF subfamily)
MQDTRPDSDIIDQVVRRRDVHAYGILVTRYERGVLAAVLPFVRDVHAAQDVTQEAFVQAFTKLGSLREPSRFGTWLMTIAERQAMRTARNAGQKTLELNHAEQAPAKETTELLDDERRQLLDAVRQLPAHERAVVSLRYFDALGVNEIAHITDRSVGTVTKQLSRALQRLREDLLPENPTWQIRKSMSV